jgi:hypothetical protein
MRRMLRVINYLSSPMGLLVPLLGMCAAARGIGSLTQSIRVRRNTLGPSD